jgi:hemerythrin
MQPDLELSKMALAYWRDICITNFPEIDEEHAGLIKVLQSVYQDIQLGNNRIAIQSKLNYLFEAALSHCEHEERLMEAYGYPDLSLHADKHEELLNNVLNLRLKAEDCDVSLTLDMIHSIATWLGRHSWDDDQKFVQFLRQRQQRETLLFN